MNQLQSGIPLQEVLYNSPRMVFSVMPLYLPFIWMAYSSSKKVNLSKRLVEEYAHKEVLSKTFEGLSRQIDDIEESEISSDLRIKLLFNILEVSSENPGKLITDYNKADHPLMDALDKSYKLGEAVDTLSKIPGLSKITRMLKDKSDLMLQEQSQNVEDGLNSLTPKSKNKTTATVDE